MEEYIEQYHQFLKPHISESTYQGAKYILPLFFSYLESKEVGHIGDVTHEVLRDWMHHLIEERKLSTSTQRAQVSRIRHFFRWLEDEGIILHSPAREALPIRRTPKNTRTCPSQNSALQAIDGADMSLSYPYRNRAILELAYGTGLRRGEIQRLNVRDVEEEYLRVIGKGNKERIVPLGKVAREAVYTWIRTERLRITTNRNPLEPALFISQAGNRLAPGSYNMILKRQVKSPYSLHSFRHACSTHMLENGCDIRPIQKILGHTKLETTQEYVHVGEEAVKKMLENSHPREDAILMDGEVATQK